MHGGQVPGAGGHPEHLLLDQLHLHPAQALHLRARRDLPLRGRGARGRGGREGLPRLLSVGAFLPLLPGDMGQKISTLFMTVAKIEGYHVLFSSLVLEAIGGRKI